jgi:G3E family GTPase
VWQNCTERSDLIPKPKKHEQHHGESGHECSAECDHHDHDHHDEHDHEHHRHDPAVGSIGIVVPGELDEKKVNQWFSRLLMEKGQDLYRMKGILSLRDDPNRFIFQGVHMTLDSTVGSPWGTAPRGSKLIFIGKNLNRDELELGVKECSVK